MKKYFLIYRVIAIFLFFVGCICFYPAFPITVNLYGVAITVGVALVDLFISKLFGYKSIISELMEKTHKGQ